MIALVRHYIAVSWPMQPCCGNKQIHLPTYTTAVSRFIPFLPIGIFCGGALLVFDTAHTDDPVLVGAEVSERSRFDLCAFPR